MALRVSRPFQPGTVVHNSATIDLDGASTQTLIELSFGDEMVPVSHVTFSGSAGSLTGVSTTSWIVEFQIAPGGAWGAYQGAVYTNSGANNAVTNIGTNGETLDDADFPLTGADFHLVFVPKPSAAVGENAEPVVCAGVRLRFIVGGTPTGTIDCTLSALVGS